MRRCGRPGSRTTTARPRPRRRWRTRGSDRSDGRARSPMPMRGSCRTPWRPARRPTSSGSPRRPASFAGTRTDASRPASTAATCCSSRRRARAVVAATDNLLFMRGAPRSMATARRRRRRRRVLHRHRRADRAAPRAGARRRRCGHRRGRRRRPRDRRRRGDGANPRSPDRRAWRSAAAWRSRSPTTASTAGRQGQFPFGPLTGRRCGGSPAAPRAKRGGSRPASASGPRPTARPGRSGPKRWGEGSRERRPSAIASGSRSTARWSGSTRPSGEPGRDRRSADRATGPADAAGFAPIPTRHLVAPTLPWPEVTALFGVARTPDRRSWQVMMLLTFPLGRVRRTSRRSDDGGSRERPPRPVARARTDRPRRRGRHQR